MVLQQILIKTCACRTRWQVQKMLQNKSAVVVQLVDFSSCDFGLRRKFSNQQAMRTKWLQNRKDAFTSFIPIEYSHDRQIAIQSIRHQAHCIKEISTSLQNDKSIALEAVKKSGQTLQLLSESLRDDFDIVLQAVLNDGWSFNSASYRLKNDMEIVLTAMKDKPILDYVTRDIVTREVSLEAVKLHGYSLGDIDEELKKDEEIVYEAVKKDGFIVLKYASPELTQNQTFMHRVVLLDVFPFFESIGTMDYNVDKEFITKLFSQAMNDEHEALKIIELHPKAMEFISPQFQTKQFALEAIKLNGGAYNHLSEELRMDRECFTAALAQKNLRDILVHAPVELQQDRDLVMLAIKSSGANFEYVLPEFKNDGEMIMQALNDEGYILECASNDVQNDREFIVQAVKSCECVILDLFQAEWSHDPDFIVELSALNPHAVFSCGRILPGLFNNGTLDRDLVKKVLELNGEALSYFLGQGLDDEELKIIALRQNGYVYEYSFELFEERMKTCYPGLYLVEMDYSQFSNCNHS